VQEYADAEAPIDDPRVLDRQIFGNDEPLADIGYINYPAEWWHWSYGERYWAFQASHDSALYGPR
jgi:zinc D-Ala-D-Ala dipeptidase